MRWASVTTRCHVHFGQPSVEKAIFIPSKDYPKSHRFRKLATQSGFTLKDTPTERPVSSIRAPFSSTRPLHSCYTGGRTQTMEGATMTTASPATRLTDQQREKFGREGFLCPIRVL